MNNLDSKIVEAAVLGTVAFKNGKQAIPCLDKDLMNLCAGLPIGGGSMQIMTAWTQSFHAANLENKMTYEEFKTVYVSTYKTMMEYSPDQVGSQIYAEKLANLADEYPEFTERVENEHTT